jgi:hypothetical protein
MAFFHIPYKSPGESLVPTFGRAAAALHVVSSLGASLRRSSNTSTTVDGLFRFKSFHTLCSARPSPSWVRFLLVVGDVLFGCFC